MRVVLSLGGSMVMQDFNADRIKAYASVIEKLASKHTILVVVGGGRVARNYISTARSLGADETFCDYLGIGVTRLNAMLLASAIKQAPKVVPEDFRQAYELSLSHSVVVMGGTFPGHTTDATAALLAEFVNADVLLNATSVDGVYSADPRKDPNAVRYDRITAKELVRIVSVGETKAGSSNVIDLLAAKVIERSGIRTVIFLGEPENIEKALKGDVEGIGTVVEVDQ
ncbi:UMP kinase [Archaeoglobus veneficus]|uniref:Uridylate kinase n=1 Tax=Archaeoglobus veneficus (strain DSM 11195 / SNP6) TaxID=693661 RepID=F2KRW4_ARCVS|nr:UMP kinase [Archaeoglobus veneficus]AEA46805.1 uridylate kinase [Archaeoglobus veneficus SNP6]